MKNVIITVTDREQSFSYDVEFPPDIRGDRLTAFMFEALHELDPSVEYDGRSCGLYLQRAKHFVNSHQTFAEAGGRNGDIVLAVDMGLGGAGW